MHIVECRLNASLPKCMRKRCVWREERKKHPTNSVNFVRFYCGIKRATYLCAPGIFTLITFRCSRWRHKEKVHQRQQRHAWQTNIELSVGSCVFVLLLLILLSANASTNALVSFQWTNSLAHALVHEFFSSLFCFHRTKLSRLGDVRRNSFRS